MSKIKVIRLNEKSRLAELFDGLLSPAAPREAQIYSATPVPDHSAYRVAKDSSGAPTLLLQLDGRTDSMFLAPIRLQHLYVAHNVECDIRKPDGSAETGRFLVIRCTDADGPLVSYFLVVAEALLMSLGSAPSPTAVSGAVDTLAELFRAMQAPPRKTAQGLWAELLVIGTSKDPPTLLKSWHVAPGDLFDFGAEGQRIEVKSTLGQVRTHNFSLDQLQPQPGVSLVVCSLLVNRVARGTTIEDLVRHLLEQLSELPDQALRVHSIVTATLGTNWRQASLEAFDIEHAKAMVKYYLPGEIPSIGSPVPVGVSEVRFRSDLSGSRSLAARELRDMGGIVALLKPSIRT